ncbi:zinc metalloproteinase nas-4-like [Hydractinia symbiolongicarpus]|uniref:zinc metalloproteinase nas-4-like n=1 Tax=Hydractinia symbiolongicarpus TaxID=13093 RepID=UPI00254FB9BD|nr:zinc metalloproteinase nas-4-like [Hydractinia symbiolongicarpus]
MRRLAVLALWLLAVVFSVEAWTKAMENPSLYQGDMILSPAQREYFMKGRSKAYGSIADVTKLWPKGVVPYVITSSLQKNSKAMSEIQEAFNQYHKYTCIRFVARKKERDYIKFYQGNSCSSMVGKQTWAQLISLASGCWWRTTIMHEIGHALGFEHEQSRPDRDKYVEIIWGNIHSSVRSQFEKLPDSIINSLGTPYDVRSMMHYAWNSFSKKMSIRTLDPRDQYEIGQRDGFSHIDIQQINLLYRCNGTYPTLPPYVKPPKGCFDISPFCAKNAFEGKCNQPSWKWFMSKECRRTCKLCESDPNTSKPFTAATKRNTKTTSKAATTTKATTTTKKSGGRVTQPTKFSSTSKTVCQDRVNCLQFPKERCNSTNNSWKYYMSRSCKKYCGLC